MVAVRLDRRVAARVDPSDVVQEALPEAALKVSDQRQAWQKLWAEVKQLRTRPGGDVPGPKK
jgi:hypothetical protein